jgi:hypothetical protein
MRRFISEVLAELQKENHNLSQSIFILPSKRAGLFLKHEIAKTSKIPTFAPEICSIEELVEEIAQLKNVPNTELLFEFYTTYLKLTDVKAQDTFDAFSKWGQILIQDFNEIDRYLIPQEQIFNYLAAVQELNHWSVEKNQTDFIKNYLSFWNKLGTYYKAFTVSLLEQGIGYQGLLYRKAVGNLSGYLKTHNNKQFVFLGFNALNTAEETIIQTLLKKNKAKIYWDIDRHFINNPKHDAALFTRQHKQNWPHFKANPFNWVTTNYTKQKQINIYGIPKNVGQAKYIGELLERLHKRDNALQNTAVVLGDENLLTPLLGSLPSCITHLNITMGFPIKSIPLASLFEILFQIHKNKSSNFYYKDILALVNHQFIRPLFAVNTVDVATDITTHINTNNLIYVTLQDLKQIVPEAVNNILDLLLLHWQGSITQILANCTKLIFAIKTYLNEDKTSNTLSLEYLYRFHTLFNEITRLNDKYQHIKTILELHAIYKELLSAETLDFQGEPLEGLQIMGMLESRVLDFETVIISSVNEGILPAGKSNNSFIPFDVKLENKLPTYKEKDAVYTYHFYRLLQRAKHVIILYNTEADVLVGGEKSRFITQLLLEGVHTINHQIIAPKVPVIAPYVKQVEKTDALMSAIYDVAKKGFSPSSLTNYMRNPIDFYYQKILKIDTYNDVEETVAANTLGTVVHNTLEDFYKPLVNTYLSVDIVKELKKRIAERVTYHFKNEYKAGDISKGKNLIIFEIAKRYVSNFLDAEIKDLSKGNSIKILQIEAHNTVEFHIKSLPMPVVLTGKVDRVDAYNGVTRIIDYKTGSVQQNQVEVVDWDTITTDYKKYSKSVQVLAYAYMMHQSNTVQLPLEAGIISFKNLSSGFLKFAKKESVRSRKKETLITKETLEAFEAALQTLILEICDQNIPFTEKEL